MDEIDIRVGAPDGGAKGELLDALLKFNVQATGIVDDHELSTFLRDPSGDLIAGVYGWVYGGTGEIALIWVREDQRGRGIGGSILEAFEVKAQSMGCRQMVMRTHSFQAPAFYRAHGYGDVAVIEDYPVGYGYHLLCKSLTAE